MSARTANSASAVQAALDVRVTVGRLRRRMREVATDGELTAAQASVLARVAKGDAVTASALAADEGVRPQSMAATLAALAELGLVVRTPDPSDGRRQLVALTASGRSRERGNKMARREWLTRALQEQCSEDERRTVLAAMAVLDRISSR